MRFLGNIEAKIDSKGRAFLPASFRKELQAAGEDCLVMRKDIFQPCLVLYPASVWNAQMDALRSRLNRWDSTHQAIFRQFVADAETITLDANGRFLIGRRHVKAAGIGQAVRFIGMDDTIEIWSDSRAEASFMEQEDFAKTLESIMKTGPASAGTDNGGRPDGNQ